MKRFLKNCLTFIMLLPYLTEYGWIKMTKGKHLANEIVGSKFTQCAKEALCKYMPSIKDPSDFDLFYPQAVNTMKIFNPFWTFKILSNQPDEVILHVTHCPVMDILNLFHLHELKPSVCQGDWEFAKDNALVWHFDRKHEISKGDAFCDHTYTQLPINKNVTNHICTLKQQEMES